MRKITTLFNSDKRTHLQPTESRRLDLNNARHQLAKNILLTKSNVYGHVMEKPKVSRLPDELIVPPLYRDRPYEICTHHFKEPPHLAPYLFCSAGLIDIITVHFWYRYFIVFSNEVCYEKVKQIWWPLMVRLRSVLNLQICYINEFKKLLSFLEGLPTTISCPQ